MAKEKGKSLYDFPEPGGFAHKVDLSITEAIFARDPNYNKGQTLCLLLRGEVNEALDANGEEVDIDLDEHPIMFPTGDGWDSFDNGKTAEHEKSETFFRTSMIARAIIKLVEMDVDLEERGAPTEAKIWEGLRIVFERTKITFGKDKEGKVIESERLFPVKFVGEVSEGGSKRKGKKAADDEDEKPKKKSKKAASFDLDDVDAKVLKGLKKAYAAADDANEFAELAVEVDGVAEDDALMEAVADESLYAALSE